VDNRKFKEKSEEPRVLKRNQEKDKLRKIKEKFSLKLIKLFSLLKIKPQNTLLNPNKNPINNS
jgi:hypothetical protein